MKKLTIGSAVYDDFEGVYFTYQSLRLNNMDIWDDLDLIVIDNNPESAEGQATRDFCHRTNGIRYIPYPDKRSTAVRNEIFTNSQAKFSMSIDAHVLFEPDTIKKLISFFEENPETNDLYHGPMFYDEITGHDPCSKMDPVWRDNMFGIWAYDDRGNNKNGDPFEIDMHGLGIFACRTESWLGFNEDFIGFGGEEGYIHKKFQKAGHKIWCLPFLRWLHRFQRPLGVKYPLILQERVRNYLIGHRELELPFDEIIDHFGQSVNINEIIQNLDTPPEATPDSPTEQEKVRQSHNDIQLWENSEVKFQGNALFRYLKYKLNRSYDGYGSLMQIKTEPPFTEGAKIHSVSSEDPEFPAESILSDDGSWVTSDATQGEMPHELVIDFGSPFSPDLISTLPRPGLNKGIPVDFKIYSSLDLESWQEISHVNILET